MQPHVTSLQWFFSCSKVLVMGKSCALSALLLPKECWKHLASLGKFFLSYRPFPHTLLFRNPLVFSLILFSTFWIKITYWKYSSILPEYSDKLITFWDYKMQYKKCIKITILETTIIKSLTFSILILRCMFITTSTLCS